MIEERKRSGNWFPQVGLQPFCFLVVFAALALPARANTSIFSNAGSACQNLSAATWCTELSQFGILTGLGDAIKFQGNETVNAGFGIGINGKNGSTLSTLSIAGTDTLSTSTIVDFADTVTRGSTCSGSVNLCGTGSVTRGSTVYHPSTTPLLPVNTSTTAAATLISKATTQLTNIESYLSGLSSSATFSAGSGGGGSNTAINVTTGTHTGSAYVFNAANYSQAGSLTLNCGGNAAVCANALVVVLLSGTSASFKYNVTLSDGLQSDQVIYYLNNTNGSAINLSVAPTAATITVNGDFFLHNNSDLATFGATTGNAKAVTLVGRVYGSSITFNSAGTTMSDQGIYTPEPGTSALWIGGLGSLFWLRRRRGNRPE